MTLTSTYDHRIIQGAQSGEFLRRIHELLLADEFYDEIFAALRIPYEPVRWRGRPRVHATRARSARNARVIELINAYRTPRPPDGRHRPARVHGPQASRPRHHHATA